MKGCVPENFEKCIMKGWEAAFTIKGVLFFFERSGTDYGYHLVMYRGDECILSEDIHSMSECLSTVLSTEVFEGIQLKDCYDDMIVESAYY
jgi:hypothetical protein